jgi:hypothetical protein
VYVNNDSGCSAALRTTTTTTTAVYSTDDTVEEQRAAQPSKQQADRTERHRTEYYLLEPTFHFFQLLIVLNEKDHLTRKKKDKT